MAILISGKNDMDWLREVHIPDLPKKFKSAMVYGNEDAPDMVLTYTKANPLMGDIPRKYVSNDDGDLIITEMED